MSNDPDGACSMIAHPEPVPMGTRRQRVQPTGTESAEAAKRPPSDGQTVDDPRLSPGANHENRRVSGVNARTPNGHADPTKALQRDASVKGRENAFDEKKVPIKEVFA